jgi:N-acetylglucosaminyl-diphospho-decaprenol L-rhamnosyltransferase
MASAAVTVSIVSHGHEAELSALLSDLAQHCAAWIDVVVVTHNLPPRNDGLPVHPGLTVIERCNAAPLGFGANHNAALARARSPWVLILNPDVRLRDDALGALLRRAQDGSASDPAIVVPLEARGAATAQARLRGPITPWSLVRRHALGGDAARGAPAAAGLAWASGMCLLVRTEAFGAVGGFDPRYHMYCEDWDLCARIVLQGGRIRVAQSACVAHAGAHASRRLGRAMGWHVASLARMWASPVFWRYRNIWKNA